MELDRHRVWREVAHVYEHLERHPREGYQPVVEAFITGRAAPVVVTVAETRRDPGYPWVKLYMGDDDGGYVFLHEAYLERVEVTFKSMKVAPGETPPKFPTGFQATIADDDSGFRAPIADDDSPE